MIYAALGIAIIWLLCKCRNRVYYLLKPLIPRSVRLRVRRLFADHKRGRVGDIWPIFPGSEKPPEGWPGWPDGKQFAFVLTHDVEGVEGLKQVRQLAELEMSMGFRSCFNFIPEGDYQVPPELRQWLVNNEFEVGVHDFKHDGQLFSSRRQFERCAPLINARLQEWGSTGFRGGFMLRNLEWLHELKIQYDASTFDTDPFEPQPDGVGTIFPFWVPPPTVPKPENGGQKSETRPHRSAPSADLQPPTNGACPSTSRPGYVELPYTLPQDSTLFLLLREQTSEIWRRKLDWVARNGGMALLNTHPDYINFNGSNGSGRDYPAAHYSQFLGLVKQKYEGKFWHALPKEVARFHRESVAGGCILGDPADLSSKKPAAASDIIGSPMSDCPR